MRQEEDACRSPKKAQTLSLPFKVWVGIDLPTHKLKMPRGREYLPYRLTLFEKRCPQYRIKLSKCIREVEKKSCPVSSKHGGKYKYTRCQSNPVAICRAKVHKTC